MNPNPGLCQGRFRMSFRQTWTPRPASQGPANQLTSWFGQALAALPVPAPRIWIPGTGRQLARRGRSAIGTFIPLPTHGPQAVRTPPMPSLPTFGEQTSDCVSVVRHAKAAKFQYSLGNTMQQMSRATANHCKADHRTSGRKDAAMLRQRRHAPLLGVQVLKPSGPADGGKPLRYACCIKS